jgi:hypothetical protein
VYGGPEHRLIVPWPEDGAELPDDWNGIEDSCNRRLIASAPALLAACKALVASLEWEKNRSGTTYAGYEDARAAIAKAEG